MGRLSTKTDSFEGRVLAQLRTPTGGTFGPTWSAQITRIRVGLVVTVVAVGLYIWSLLSPGIVPDVWLKVFAAISAGATFFLGYVQWHLSRHETSFDKYYDRLTTANSYIDLIGARQNDKDPDALLKHYWTMRVFTQLDSIEYVLGKYRLQFVNIDIVERAIRTFATECRDSDFRQILSDRLSIGAAGVQPRLGYHPTTVQAATYIAQHYPEF